MKIKINDTQINYEFFPRPGAPVVMLSHSLACSMVMWEPQMEILKARFGVLRYDMRGHGQSDATPGAYSLEMLAADAVALMDALALEQVHLVGLSIGGMIGQSLALNYPQRLESLVLCDTSAQMHAEGRKMFRQRIQRALEQGMGVLAQETLERWFTTPYLEKKMPMVQRIREQILSTSLDGFAGCGQAILGLDYLERLNEISLPTLIIVGEDDPGTPVSAAQAIQERIPASGLMVLPSAAHLSNIEQADQFNHALLRFLSSQVD